MKSLFYLAGLLPTAMADIDVSFPQGSITIMESTRTSGTFQVQLSAAPAGPVTVFLQSETLLLGACTLSFTPWNFNTPQIVSVVPSPFYPTALTEKTRVPEYVTAQLVDGTGCPRKSTEVLTVNFATHAGAACTSIGDPHYSTFDRVAYNWQGLGNFYVVKSPRLEIQSNHIPYGNSASVNGQVAVRWNKSIFVFIPGLGGATPQWFGEIDNEIKVTTAGSSTRLTFFDSSFVELAFRGFYYDIDVFISGYFFNSVTGECGNFNDNPTDDSMVGTAYAVPTQANLFTNTASYVIADYSNSASIPKGAGFCDEAPLFSDPGNIRPRPRNRKPGYEDLFVDKIPKFTPGQNGGPVVRPKWNPDKPLFKPGDELVQCGQIFKHPCAAIVDAKRYVDWCIADAQIAGALDPIENVRQRFLHRSKTFGESIIASGTESARSLAKRCLADINCEETGCNARGKCIDGVCHCNAGFTQKGCVADISGKSYQFI